MSVFRVDVLVEDPEPVFKWIEENVAGGSTVRKMAYQTVKGSYLKAVFKRQVDAESFRRRWHEDADTHVIASFSS